MDDIAIVGDERCRGGSCAGSRQGTAACSESGWAHIVMTSRPSPTPGQAAVDATGLISAPPLGAVTEVNAVPGDFTGAVARTTPAFSVCIVVRDRPQLLVKSIQSALESSFEDFEVVVVDDGSAVPVAERLAGAGLLSDQRVRLVRQKPSGIAAARNNALMVAQGKYVTVLDSDDELSKDGLGRVQEFLGHTGASWIYTDYHEVVSGSSKVIRLPSYKTPRQMLWAVLTRPRLPFKHSGMTVDRELLLRLGGYDERMQIKVDVELILRALRNGIQPIHLAYPIVRFHRHSDNISRQRRAGMIAWSKLIRVYSYSRIPGLTLSLIALRALSELGKSLVSSVGK